MKLFLLGAVLCSTFVIVFGAVNHTVEQEPVHSKEEEATKYCNNLYPVTEDPRQKLTKSILNGETIPRTSEFNNIEWCHLHCFLEKVGFFDAEGRMQVRKIYKYSIRTHPELAPNGHTLLVHLSQISRSMKGLEDKCMKAYVAYFRFTETILVATLVADLNAKPDVKEKVIEAALNGDALPKELEASVEKYFRNVELFFKKTVESNANITSTAAPVSAV